MMMIGESCLAYWWVIKGGRRESGKANSDIYDDSNWKKTFGFHGFYKNCQRFKG